MPYPETTVPKFGDWDGNEDLSFSIVFDKARADKERFLPTFKEDSKDTSLHQQKYKTPVLTAGRSAPNTLSNKTMETGSRGSAHISPKLSAGHACRMPADEQRNNQVDPSNLSDRGSGYSSSKPSSGQQSTSNGLTKMKKMGSHSNGAHGGAPHETLHGRGQRIPGPASQMHHDYPTTTKAMRSKGSSETSSIADMPDKIVVPKFGEWDASDAKAGDGFTVIFDRARDEKKSNTTRKTPARIISPLQPAEDLYKETQTHRKKGVNPDTFTLTGETLQSVHQVPDEDEDMIFGELYRELVEADTRATRSRRGRGRGIRVGGRGKGLLVRRTSTSAAIAEGSTQTYTRRGSSSSNPVAHDDAVDPPIIREPSFDSDGNEISHSENEDENASTSSSEESSDSLDEHSEAKSDDVDDSSSDSDSLY